MAAHKNSHYLQLALSFLLKIGTNTPTRENFGGFPFKKINFNRLQPNQTHVLIYP